MKENEIIYCACGCGKTLKKYDKYGRPRRFIRNHHRNESIEDQFWKRVKKEDGCWIWTGAKSSAGYGQLRHKNKLYYAHRISYKLHYGKDPGEFHVLHKCDNPACVNPEHLSLGSHLDNMHDCIKKRRRHDGAKACLTEKMVIDIKDLYEKKKITQKAIAEKYGVDQSHICKIVNGKRRSVCGSIV